MNSTLQPSLPAPLAEFLARFNRGEYWESHETLENAWRASRSEFYHGLILFASGYVHAQHGNRHGVSAQMHKATRHLAHFRPSYMGLDVDAIVRHAERCELLADARPATFPRFQLEARQERVRGDEQEWGIGE
ncbi:MAG: DUF309 domain-containing protein [Gemmatimonadaceae bacterium]